MTALDNIALAVQARSGASLSFWRPLRNEHGLFDEACATLEEIGLVDRAQTRVDQLAHGEQRAL